MASVFLIAGCGTGESDSDASQDIDVESVVAVAIDDFEARATTDVPSADIVYVQSGVDVQSVEELLATDRLTVKAGPPPSDSAHWNVLTALIIDTHWEVDIEGVSGFEYFKSTQYVIVDPESGEPRSVPAEVVGATNTTTVS